MLARAPEILQSASGDGTEEPLAIARGRRRVTGHLTQRVDGPAKAVREPGKYAQVYKLPPANETRDSCLRSQSCSRHLAASLMSNAEPVSLFGVSQPSPSPGYRGSHAPEAGSVRVGRADDLSIVVDSPPIAVTASAECAKISDNAVGPEHGVAEVDAASVRRADHVAKIVDVPRDGPWAIRQPGQLNDAVGIGVEERGGPIRPHGPADDVSLLVNTEGDAGRVAGQDPQIRTT